MIKAVLFDADGVLQRPTVRWREVLAPILGTADPRQIDAFLRDIAAAEEQYLCSPDGFEAALRQTLDRWSCADRIADIVRAMHAIDPYEDVMVVVRKLQSGGMPCHIASNQQAGRAHHMSVQLNYRQLFVREFYSCALGVAKPEVDFFHRVLDELELPGPSVLFLDDRADNVEAAGRAGLAAQVYTGESGAEVLISVLASHGVRVHG